MGTAKRERQKANKARREQEVARQQTRSRSTRIGLLVAAAIIAVFVLVFVAGRFMGDDADSVGAVAGQLAGARYGLTGIPQNWLDVLIHRERIEAIGHQLFDASINETGGREIV